MYRASKKGYCVVTYGLVSKHYQVRHDNRAGFTNSFNEVLLVLTNTEGDKVYQRTFDALDKFMHHTVGVDNFCHRVNELSGDWHHGLECARKAKLVNSIRLGDWSHLMGLTRPKAAQIKVVEAADSEGVHAWRTGVLSCLRKRLNNQDLLEDLREALHATRNAPASVFNTIWSEVLASLTGTLVQFRIFQMSEKLSVTLFQRICSCYSFER